MITEWLIDSALRVVVGITGFLPEVDLDLTGVSGALGLALTFDSVLPVTEGLAVASLMLGVTGVMFAWRVLRTLLSHVPWIGGSG